MSEHTFDVATNIRMTEQLQCQMLALLSDFFTGMHQNVSKSDQAEILADMEIALFLMAKRLGISKELLDRKAVSAIRATLLKTEHTLWKEDLLHILYAMENDGTVNGG